MAYRSERFDPGELAGLQQAWDVVDLLDTHGVPVISEVMAGSSHRRRLHPDTVAEHGDINYLLQVTMQPAPWEDGGRLHARPYLEKANELLGAIEMPGETAVDPGGLHGWDVTTTTKHPLGTGVTETEVLQVYPAWFRASWEEAGRRCVFYCGIQPPDPKLLMEDWMFRWEDRRLRAGEVVFEPTPTNLETW